MGQAPAGWYPQQDGRQRYWDGTAWTEHFAPGTTEQPRSLVAQAAAALGDPAAAWGREPDTLWAAVGRPLTGIGAGRYRLTAHYLFFERGILFTDSQQVPVAAIVDVDVRQSMTQKARSVGTVLVHVQRSRGIEVVTMADIPDPRGAQQVLNETAHGARVAIRRHENTHRYEMVGGAPVASPARAEAPQPSAMGPLEQLRQLGELRDAGVVTEEEFAAKKADILSRM